MKEEEYMMTKDVRTVLKALDILKDAKLVSD